MPTLSALLALALAMIGGLALSRLMKILHLPNVTGYLFAGLLIGPYLLPLIFGDGVCLLNHESVQSLSSITNVALGFIAFSIGGEFKLSYIKKLGVRVIIITLVQAFTTVLFVIGALLLIPNESDTHRISMALLLGAIAAATAPAATLMVVRQYRAKGPVTDTLLPVVAFDDAIGLMIFSVCFSLAKSMSTGAAITVHEALLKPLLEIAMSIGIGATLGAILALCMRVFHSRANRLCLMITAVILGVAFSDLLDLSSLLVCMMIGALFANLRNDAAEILDGTEQWTPPLFMLFFVLSGAELDLTILPIVGVMGFVYLAARSLGKYFGAFFGAMLSKSERTVRHYLGITLLPQAGVAIGMAQSVAANPELHSAGISSQIVAIVLFATLVYELVGPVATKIALTAAGEIPKQPKRQKKAKASKA